MRVVLSGPLPGARLSGTGDDARKFQGSSSNAASTTLVGVYVGGLPHRVGPVNALGRVPYSNSRIGGTVLIGSILYNCTVSS